jgi:hypothetical protein
MLHYLPARCFGLLTVPHFLSQRRLAEINCWAVSYIAGFLGVTAVTMSSTEFPRRTTRYYSVYDPCCSVSCITRLYVVAADCAIGATW